MGASARIWACVRYEPRPNARTPALARAQEVANDIGMELHAEETEGALRARLRAHYGVSQPPAAPEPEPEPTAGGLNPESPWAQYRDESRNLPYYFNLKTQETLWDLPPEGVSIRVEE